MQTATRRLAPIAEEHWTQAQRELVQAIASGPRGGLRGPFIPLLHSPGLTAELQRVGEYLRFKGVLPQSLTELAILVTARACGSPYEWAAHAPLALAQGVAESVIKSIGEGRRPQTDSVQTLAVYDFAAMILQQKNVSDSVYEAVRVHFGESGVVDLIGICGYYTLLAMVLNTANMPLPAGRTAPF